MEVDGLAFLWSQHDGSASENVSGLRDDGVHTDCLTLLDDRGCLRGSIRRGWRIVRVVPKRNECFRP